VRLLNIISLISPGWQRQCGYNSWYEPHTVIDHFVKCLCIEIFGCEFWVQVSPFHSRIVYGVWKTSRFGR